MKNMGLSPKIKTKKQKEKIKIKIVQKGRFYLKGLKK